LKKKDRLKGVGKWECEVGQDWSSSSSVEVEGISENAGNVSVHYSLQTIISTPDLPQKFETFNVLSICQ